MPISRRVFVRAGALGLVSYGLDPLFLDRAAYALTRRTGAPASRRTLVCLFQRGAVDGLSMIVPHGEAEYYQERPRIAIPRQSLVDLDGHFGLHPQLAPLKPFWDAGSLTAIHAVGSPDATRSHFDAQDYMESGTPGVKSTTDGWANRYCRHDQEHARTPFRAVAFGPQLPRSLQGVEPALAMSQIGQFGIRAGQATDTVQASFESEYAAAADAVLHRTGGQAFDAVRMLKSADPAKYQPENGAEYPRSAY